VTRARLIQGRYAGENKLSGPEESAHQKAQDEWQRQLEKGVARAMAKWLVDNRLASYVRLSWEQLEGMGIAACAEYVKLREAEALRSSNQSQTDSLNQSNLPDISNA